MREVKMISDVRDIETPSKTTVYYDEYGKECVEVKAVAQVDTFGDGQTKYSIMKDGNSLVDLLNANYSRRNQFRWKMSVVNEKCFSSYLAYLKDRKQAYYTNAMKHLHNN